MGVTTIPRRQFHDRVLYAKTHVDPPGDPRNPFPTWAKLREEPVKIVDPKNGFPPFVHVFRYRDALQIANDHDTYSSVSNQKMVPLGKYTLVALDPPEHTYYRSYLLPILAPNAVAHWKDDLIGDVLRQLIGGIVERGKADLVSDFNFNYPALVVLRIIGFPQEEFEQLQAWSAALSNAPAEPEAGWKAAEEVIDYVRPFVEGKRPVAEDTILYTLMHTEVAGKRLEYIEIQSFILQLIMGGLDTTYRSLGATMMMLLDRPEILDRVRKDRALAPKAIEEALRYDGPSAVGNRVTKRDTEIGGVKIPEGVWVIPVRSAANRDPECVPDPDTYSIDRPPSRHLAFGAGIHVCLGQHLARMELTAAVNALFDNLPNLRWDEAEKARVDPHMRGGLFRSPTALPVVWDV